MRLLFALFFGSVAYCVFVALLYVLVHFASGPSSVGELCDAFAPSLPFLLLTISIALAARTKFAYVVPFVGAPACAVAAALLAILPVRGSGGYAAEQGMALLAIPFFVLWSLTTIPFFLAVTWIARERGESKHRRLFVGVPAFLVLSAAISTHLRHYGPAICMMSDDETPPSSTSLSLLSGESPLLSAAKLRSRELALAALAQGAPEVDVATLEWLASNQDHEFLDFLRSQAVLPVRTADCRALHLAIRSGGGPVLSLLLDYGANVEAVDPETGRTPLMEAAFLGREESVQLLLLHGAHPKRRTDGPRDAIEWADDGNQPAIAALLRKAPEPYVLESGS